MEQKVKKITDEINKELLNGINRDKTLDKAIAYALEVRGKRLRPLLFLTFIDAYAKRGFEYKKYFDIASAIEYIHTYSLIHDDLPSMDNDDFRRGQPTVHKKFDSAIALLAGDTLLTLAFEKIAKSNTSNDNIVEIIKVISESIGSYGMAGGQALDLEFSGDKDDILSIHKMKTADLITGAILSAAEIIGMNQDEKEQVKEAGKMIGIAFQMADDLLDIEGDEVLVGKKLNKDFGNNSPNSVLFYGKNYVKNEIESYYNKTLEIFKKLKVDSPVFLFLIRKMVYRTK
jgi:geranylgeranyl diphosphate synthase type II